MKILFLNAYFFPEVISFTHLEKDLIEGLIAAGHKIEVICPLPTRGISREVAEGYKDKKHECLYDRKVSVRRFWAPQEGRNPLVRAFRYLWCNLREYQIGRKYRDIDAVFAVSTPPTQGLLAGKLSRKLGCPFIYSLQDVFPDSLVTTGLTKQNSLMWKVGRRIEIRSYGYANQVVVISESCRRNLLNKGVELRKVKLISNWVDVDEIHPVERCDNKLISEFNIDENKFLVVYAGNFGAAQGADIVLKAAENLLNEKGIQFVVFGGGAEFDSAVEFVKDKKLTNVMIHSLLPQNRVSEVYSLGDVALIICKVGVGNSGMPSKTWSIMACNTPIIASYDVDSDLSAILAESNAGICVQPSDAQKLADAILLFSKRKTKRSEVLIRDYIEDHASRKMNVEKYISLFESLCTN